VVFKSSGRLFSGSPWAITRLAYGVFAVLVATLAFQPFSKFAGLERR
jgi:hypothetical protein